MTYTRSSKKPTTATKASAVQKPRVPSDKHNAAVVAEAVPAILVITPEKKKPKQASVRATAVKPKSRNPSRRHPVARALNGEEKKLVLSQRKSQRFRKATPASPAAKLQSVSASKVKPVSDSKVKGGVKAKASSAQPARPATPANKAARRP
jgi:hypothetical protein